MNVNLLSKVLFFIFYFMYNNRSNFFYKPSLILFTLKTDLVNLLKRRHIHEVNLFSLILAKCLSYEFNISFNIMQRGYVGHWSLGDQTLSRQNGCLTPPHFTTQPLSLVFLDRQISVLSFLILVGCSQDQSFVFFCIDCNQDPKSCKV